MAEVNRNWLFRNLRDSLRLLSADGVTALAGVPEGCCKPDELALDFDNFRGAVVGNFAAELPSELIATLAEMDEMFDAITGDGWTEAAVRSAPEWAALRQKAEFALRILDELDA
ncbi:MAG: hypothetical protein K1X57_17810 [Gemmataceae bacterium]|nr:hypothetical protein [Gemmataceae bacterium]